MNTCSRLLLQRAVARASGTVSRGSSIRYRLPREGIATTPSFFHSTAVQQQRSFETTFDLPDPAVVDELHRQFPLTKIVATVGPTSEQMEPLKQCVKAGLHSMRLNFSHATAQEVELRCANLKHAVQTLTPVHMTRTQDVVSILLDTKGPELRTGKLAHDVSGHDTVELVAGETVTLHASSTTLPDPAGSTATDLLIDFKVLAHVLEKDRLVLLDDGAVVLVVVQTNVTAGTVQAVVQNSGSLRSRAGVNLPLADTAQHLPALSEKDKHDIAYGMRVADIDVVAASFVQTAQHVIDIRLHCMATAAALPEWNNKPLPLIISKIETASALQHFDEILKVSDGIMVARGDLGVEIPLQQVTNAQKEMVAACNAAGKPVIVATQMLESMSKSPRPTRAEVSDVTNAVYDGADCVMLSGETAKGKYPVQTIKMMREIIMSAERYASNQKALGHPEQHKFIDSPKTAASAIAKAAVTAAHEHGHCSSILVVLQPPTTAATTSADGSSPAPYTLPGLIAAHRPSKPIFTFCHTPKQARQLQLYRGIHPVLMQQSADSSTEASVVQEAKQMGYVTAGDEVVLVVEDRSTAGGKATTTASMKIVTVS